MPLWKDNHSNDLIPFSLLSRVCTLHSLFNYCPALYSAFSLCPYSSMSTSISTTPPPPPQHHHHYPYGKTGDHSIRCELLTPTEHSKARFWLQINTPKPAPDTNWTLPCQLLTSTEHFKVSCWLQLDTLKQTPDSRFEVNPPMQTPSTGLRHPSFNHCRI